MKGSVNEAECIAAGVDPREVARIAHGISRYAQQAEALGITIFGGTTGGTLRFNDDSNGVNTRSLIIATISGGDFDGGDGSTFCDSQGLLRGE